MEAIADELTAILSECNGTPADEVPLLVAADWLDERGDPRGEAIRRDIVPNGRRPYSNGNNGWWWNSAQHDCVENDLPENVARFIAFWFDPDETVADAYLNAAQAYAAKRQYKTHLRAIHHASDGELFGCMTTLAIWLESRGDSESRGWRWLVNFGRKSRCERGWDDSWYWVAGAGSAGLSHEIYELLKWNEGYGYSRTYYPSRLSALLDAARAAAKVV